MRDCFVKLHKMPPTLQISEKYVKINEELMRGEIQDKENIHSDREEELKSDDEEIDVETVDEGQATIDDEPVSPPPCKPEEAPTLLQTQSKTIEEIAIEVVDENRAKISVSPLLKEDEIPKTVFKPSTSFSSRVPSLIPLTVAEIDETESKLASQSLHMSGGGVYTTDSFFYSQNLHSQPSPGQLKSRTSVIKRNPSPGGDRVNKRKASPGLNRDDKGQEEIKSELDNLLDFYQTSTTLTPTKQTAICRIPQATIKFSDSLEITPIKIMPIELTSEPLLVNKVSHSEMESNKRKHESKDNGTKKFRTNELVIEKIPRTSTEETRNHVMVSQRISEKKDDEETSLSCKLVLSKSNKRKYELVFENGQSLFLNRNLFKSLDFSEKSQNIRRKKVQSRKQKTPLKTNVKEQIFTPGTNRVFDVPQNNPIMNGDLNNDCNLSNESVTKAPEVATPAKHECIDKETVSSDSTIADKSELQNPLNISKIPETLGLHKLPSIVNQPSYLRVIKRQSEKSR